MVSFKMNKVTNMMWVGFGVLDMTLPYTV